MTSIRTNCPRCGEVEMDAEVVLLAFAEPSGEGSYSFVCPVCEEVIRKPADRNIVALLLSAGVQVHPEASPPKPEVGQAPSPGGSGAPAFTTDDLIEFHYLLERPDWFRLLLDTATR
jgi:predicted RNA-binding Zn-ribbon protein involved in translation (DUF1610 family)